MILLSKIHIDYWKAPKGELVENFTFKNLYAVESNFMKKVESKSIILAPYYSILSESEEESHSENLDFDNLSINIENNIRKFCGKVKEYNIKIRLSWNIDLVIWHRKIIKITILMFLFNVWFFILFKLT